MTNTKTFRLFISSTFSDFQEEREVLHKEVFPELEQYCESRGCQFQPIDLRWGVNVEAQLDQKTLQVCLDEVRACKHYPHPNFLIMAGERYGWVPLPYAIDQSEFERILHFHKKKDRSGLHLQDYPIEIALLNHWYRLDTNQVPAKYILRSREDFTSRNDIPKHFQHDYASLDSQTYSNLHWQKEESIMLASLQEAAKALHVCGDMSGNAYRKHFLSATEQEVIEGICDYRGLTKQQETDDTCNSTNRHIEKRYIYGYLRDVSAHNELTKEQENFRKHLKSALLPENVIQGSDAKVFANEITKRLKTAIDDALKEQGDNSVQTTLNHERAEQLAFRRAKLKGYVERSKTQEAIKRYLETEGSHQPFILHARSGMGKSAVIAKAIDTHDIAENTIIYRFVGATERSRDIRSLLISITTDLTQDYERVYKADHNEFNDQIKEILEKVETPTIIFIDALDQLLDQDYLMWLPETLPENLKIVLSVLNDPEYDKDSHYYKILQLRFERADFFNLEEDPIENSEELIDTLLKLEQRTLTPTQKSYLITQFDASERSPLWMKIAIEEVKEWSSDEKRYELKVGVKAIINEFINNLHHVYHHQPMLIEKVLGYIHASKDGLSEKELLDILSEELHDEPIFKKQILNKFHTPIKIINPRRNNQEELRLPLAHWSRLHVQLKPFLVSTNIDNQPLMKFFHRQFTTVIQERTEKQSQNYHSKLAEYFLAHQDKNKTWDKRYHNLRMLEETPYQLFKAKKAKQLKALLFDLEFLGSTFSHNKHMALDVILSKIADPEMVALHRFIVKHSIDIRSKKCARWQKHQILFQLLLEYQDFNVITDKAIQEEKRQLITWKFLKKRFPKEKIKYEVLYRDSFSGGFEQEIKGISGNQKAYIAWSRKDVKIYSYFQKIGELSISNSYELKYTILTEDKVVLLFDNNIFKIYDKSFQLQSIFYVSKDLKMENLCDKDLKVPTSHLEIITKASWLSIGFLVQDNKKNIFVGIGRKAFGFNVKKIFRIDIEEKKILVPKVNETIELENSGFIINKNDSYELIKIISDQKFSYGNRLTTIGDWLVKWDLDEFKLFNFEEKLIRDDSYGYTDNIKGGILLLDGSCLLWKYNCVLMLIDANGRTVEKIDYFNQECNGSSSVFKDERERFFIMWDEKRVIVLSNKLKKLSEMEMRNIKFVMQRKNKCFLLTDNNIYCFEYPNFDIYEIEWPYRNDTDINLKILAYDLNFLKNDHLIKSINKLAQGKSVDVLLREPGEEGCFNTIAIYDKNGALCCVGNGQLLEKRFEQIAFGTNTFATWDNDGKFLTWHMDFQHDKSSRLCVLRIKNEIKLKNYAAKNLIHLKDDSYVLYFYAGGEAKFILLNEELSKEEFYLVPTETTLALNLIGNNQNILYFVDQHQLMIYELINENSYA